MEWTQDRQVLLRTFVEHSNTEANQKPVSEVFPLDNGRLQDESYNAISSNIQTYLNDIYPWLCVSKGDVFYYVYGLIHSEYYRAHYAGNLGNQWPATPSTEDFTIYVSVGRKLAGLHFCYEKTPLYKGVQFTGSAQGLVICEQQLTGG